MDIDDKNRNVVVKYYYILAHARVNTYIVLHVITLYTLILYVNLSRITIFDNISLLFIVFMTLIYYSVLNYLLIIIFHWLVKSTVTFSATELTIWSSKCDYKNLFRTIDS